MLLKRFLVLATAILCFIAFFVFYFEYNHAVIESHFQEERATYHVDNAVLIASTPTPATAPVVTTPAADTNLIIGPVPPQSSDSSTTPAPSPTPAPPASTDIPVPPSASPAPASTDVPVPSTVPPTAAPSTDVPVPSTLPPVPATPDPSAPSTTPPAPADPNAAPMKPSSTRNDPLPDGSPFVLLAAYHPGAGLFAQAPAVEPAPPVIAPISAPAPVVAPAPAAPTPTAAPAAPETPTATVVTPAAPESFPASGRVIVLLYHQFVPAGVHISPKLQWTLNQDVFAQEMKYIHDNGYTVVSIQDVLRFLRHEITLPANSVAITIDDGYKSAIVYAAPILKQYGFPWTYFIYPEFITVNENKGSASWNDLLALQAEGVDIESHSMTHPNLKSHKQKVGGVVRTLTPAEYEEFLINETSGSKAILEQKLGKKINCFAYPYGNRNPEVKDKTVAAGYEAIFTVDDNPVRSTTSETDIGRYTITQAVVKNFEAYLRQGLLPITQSDPAPGSTISNPRPVITAVLAYPGTLDASSMQTEVRDFGPVKNDYDPVTHTVRLYLTRDLVRAENLVNIWVKDARSGQVLVANWEFNYEPGGGATHPPIAAPASTAAPVAPSVAPVPSAAREVVPEPGTPSAK